MIELIEQRTSSRRRSCRDALDITRLAHVRFVLTNITLGREQLSQNKIDEHSSSIQCGAAEKTWALARLCRNFHLLAKAKVVEVLRSVN